MSQLKNASEVEDCEFTWGKKKGIGGKKKEVQFYESFTYDGEEYSLYDNVYLYKDDETVPYIGKLVKIWEQPPQKKRVKVLWFFRPVEIRKWLEDVSTLENEIFLASGDGVGLANMNPLEAIAGKCHVVCTSKDSRNPQPSPEELTMADYVFYRTFDVGNCTISEKIEDKIAGFEVSILLNREGGQQSSDVLRVGPAKHEENGNVMASNELSQQCSKSNIPETLVNRTRDDMLGTSLKKKDDFKDSFVNQDPLPGESFVSDLGAETKETQGHVPSHEKSLSRPIPDSCKDDVNTDSISISKAVHKRLESSNDLGVLDDKPSKKARVDSSFKVPKAPRDSAYDDKTKSKPFEDPRRPEKASLKKVQPDEKSSKISSGTQPKATAAQASEKNLTSAGQVLEVTRRPDTDRSKWFKGLPWDERMQAAHEQGTLVLLENLDPAYSSAEIEDIVWSGFREHCTAKVVPHTSISSPDSGQAFVIFKTRDAANTAVQKLDEGCLMLSNGRPLVASWEAPATLYVNPSTFWGHLVIDKINFKMQREEQREAISTSHCSQPNTIEYDMAMEWCLLQTRSDSMWKELYKLQGGEIKKLKANLKSK